jgi:uncharacterized Zn finger protein
VYVRRCVAGDNSGYLVAVSEADLRHVRIAENQSLFRSANENIEASAESMGLVGGRLPFICECPDTTCTHVVQLTLLEYEEVRVNPVRFFCVLGHHTSAVGAGAAVMVDERAGVVVVDAVGVAAEVAEERYEEELLRD